MSSEKHHAVYSSSRRSIAFDDARRERGRQRVVELGEDDVRRHHRRHARPAIARLNGRISRSSSTRRGCARTAGSSRWESRSVSPWPGKCFAQAATPPPCSPLIMRDAQTAHRVGVVAERAVADDRALGVRVHVHDRREVEADPAGAQLRGQRGAQPPRQVFGAGARRAPQGRPDRPGRAHARHAAAFLVHRDQQRLRRARRHAPIACSSRIEFRHLLRVASTLRAKRMTWPTPNSRISLLDVRRGLVARRSRP